MAKVAAITIALTRLSSNYWRPDFTEAQARLLICDYVEDLREFSPGDVDAAIRQYRQDSSNQFFPRSSQLRDLILNARKETLRPARCAMTDRPLPESRPIFWWMTGHWKPHWRESEIPEEHRAAWERWKARMAEKSAVNAAA